MNMKMLPSLVVAGLLSVSACANMNQTEQRTLSGAAGGAVAGTVVGAIAGNAGLGAVVGAGVGAAGGYIWDQHKEAEQRSYERGVADGRGQP
jgi:uncharacterized membrane protein